MMILWYGGLTVIAFSCVLAVRDVRRIWRDDRRYRARHMQVCRVFQGLQV